MRAPAVLFTTENLLSTSTRIINVKSADQEMLLTVEMMVPQPKRDALALFRCYRAGNLPCGRLGSQLVSAAIPDYPHGFGLRSSHLEKINNARFVVALNFGGGGRRMPRQEPLTDRVRHSW